MAEHIQGVMAPALASGTAPIRQPVPGRVPLVDNIIQVGQTSVKILGYEEHPNNLTDKLMCCGFHAASSSSVYDNITILPFFVQVSPSAKLAQGMDHHLDSKDRVSSVPYSRWDLDSLWRGEKAARARFGAFLTDAAGFDSAAFGISVPEAELMDPQQRMLLEVQPFCPEK